MYPHLASAVGGVQYIKARNVDNLTPSVLMNANMVEAARNSGAERFLFTSSACVYPDQNESLTDSRRSRHIRRIPQQPTHGLRSSGNYFARPITMTTA